MPKHISYHSLEHQQQGNLIVTGINFNHNMDPGVSDFSVESGCFFTYFHTPICINTDDELISYQKGAFICWPQKTRIRFGHPVKRWENSYLIFRGSRAQELLDAFPCRQVFMLGDPEYLLQGFREIYRELTDHYVPNTRIVSNVIENIMLHILRVTNHKVEDKQVPKEYLEIKKYISNHFQEAIRVERLADKMQVTHTYFSRQFKKFFACTPLEYLIQTRMEHAQGLLQQTNMKIADIAKRVGFENSFYFSNTIRKHFKCGPRELRKRMASGM